jgi:hypothetical protein
MNLWPSRGLSVHGFEVKVSRSDWLSELRNPAKSASIQQFCDYWWLVVGDKDIVQPGELPDTWGLLTVEGKEKKRLVCRKVAPKLEAQPLDRTFIASMMRRAAETVADYENNRVKSEEYQKGFEEGQKAGVESLAWMRRDAERRVDELQQRIEAFEEASGVRIDQWQAKSIGRAVKIVLKHYQRPMSFAKTIDRSMKPLEVLLKAMEQLKTTFEMLDVEGHEEPTTYC